MYGLNDGEPIKKYADNPSNILNETRQASIKARISTLLIGKAIYKANYKSSSSQIDHRTNAVGHFRYFGKLFSIVIQ